MLRKRPSPMGAIVSNNDEPPHKQLGKFKKVKHVSLRDLASTLSAAVLAAVNPSPDVRSQAYSEYLTSQVEGLTIGWHIFRTITEGAFLLTYGFSFKTFVVQLFWTISASSVLLYFLGRNTWLRLREGICIWANVTYGIITVLKIFHLVDRLPNENHYMFKHCFLTMADAAFSQTPVHKQYVVQFAEAVIRVIVWRRYNVLADTPTWGVITISLAWQLWLVTFSSMLQARHVSAFRRQRRRADATGGSGCSGPSHTSARSSTSNSAAAAAAVTSTSRPSNYDIEPPSGSALTAVVAAMTSSGSSVQEDRDEVISSVTSPQSSIGAAASASATDVTVRVSSEHRTAGMPSTAEPLRQSSVAGLSAPSSSQKRFTRALRGVARGPSSYVLLSHQRRQAGGPQCSSAQFYIPAAKPEMLSGNWRERLVSAIAEGAPGWHVANICVRKGSLIVHLDLVYAPTPRGGEGAGMVTAAATAATMTVATASMGVTSLAGGSVATAGAGDIGFPGASYSELPFDGVGGHDSKAVLDDFVNGMDADSLLELLGLPPDLPAGPAKPISVQLGDQIKNLPSSASDAPTGPCTAATVDITTSTITATSITSMASEIEAEAAAAPSAVKPPKEVATADAVAAARLPAWRRLFSQPLQTALFPPAELCSPEYCCFLSERVGALHLAYAAFICLTAVALLVVRSYSAINPVSLLLFMSAELLSLSTYATMGGAVWRSIRCGLVYLGVVLRTLHMAACTSGVLPHVLKDTDCISGRWIQKVMLITTLQALCMQPPVRTFFLVRFPSVMLSMYVHVFVCQTNSALRNALILHLSWEGLLFLISANLQLRHLEAFCRQHHSNSSSGGCCQEAAAAAAAAIDAATAISQSQVTEGQTVVPPPCSRCCAAGGDAKGAKTTGANGIVSGSALPVEDEKLATATAVAPATAPFVCEAAIGDPCDVSLSAQLVVMAPRRAAHLQLHFTCAPAIMEELQVVLRHINPASMSSGVHAAHSVRDITRALVAPAGATAALPHVPASFSADLTLVASPADMPGLVHVELWRGRRRICSYPVLLAAALEASVEAMAPTAAARCVSASSGPDASTWIDDIRCYVNGLRNQGHVAAADQFLEELGTWLAQAAALERGLVGGTNSGGASAPRVANVLYFHGYGSEFMYVKAGSVSGGASGTSVGVSSPAADPLQETLRQLLLCQGSMLLAVAVEAGCVALSEHLMGMLVGEMSATLRGLLEGARTPVTQLPLLHAAVKSCDARMVDLVAEWSASCGLKDIWGHEAAVLAVSLDSCASSTVGNTASLEAAGAAVGAVAQLSAGAASALHRFPRVLPQLPQDGARPTGSTNPSGSSSAGLAAAATAISKGPPADPISGSSYAAGMDTTASVDLEDMDVPDMDVDLNLGFDVKGKDLSEESPFRIVDFRASNRPTASSGSGGTAVSTNTVAGGLLIRRDNAVSVGAANTAGSGGSRSTGGLGGGSSLDRLVDGGVLVLTPLHISLVLGDEGQLARHILKTYPEAYELWRSSHLTVDMDPSVALTSAYPSRAGISASASVAGLPLPPPATEAAVASPPAGLLLSTIESASNTSSVWRQVSTAAPAYSSMPGLASLVKTSGTGHGIGGGGGMGVGLGLDVGADDSMGGGSVQSLSLSEVAFFEGFRWVDGDTTAARPGFKVTRL